MVTRYPTATHTPHPLPPTTPPHPTLPRWRRQCGLRALSPVYSNGRLLCLSRTHAANNNVSIIAFVCAADGRLSCLYNGGGRRKIGGATAGQAWGRPTVRTTNHAKPACAGAPEPTTLVHNARPQARNVAGGGRAARASPPLVWGPIDNGQSLLSLLHLSIYRAACPCPATTYSTVTTFKWTHARVSRPIF